MCYSAQVNQRLKTLRRRYSAHRDDPAFEKLFRDRLTNERILIPKVLEANFYSPEDDTERRIQKLIEEYHG